MYQDIINYTCNYPQCAMATGVGRRQSPPMKSIPVDHPFQIVGIDTYYGVAINHHWKQVCNCLPRSVY